MPDDTPTDLVARLTADMKAALKAGEKDRLQVIRMLLSEARAADLQKPVSTPDKMVQAYHKKLEKSRVDYEKAGDADRLAALDAELAVVADYVPKKASATETGVLVDDFLAARPDLGPGDIGKATGLFMKEHGGNVDAKAANTRIRQILQGR